MNRRTFVQLSALGAAGLALTRSRYAYADEFSDMKKRVALIGSGWYGKADLLRLIQVAPVNVVSICDVDKKMAEDAAELIASRQVSKAKPRIYSDYRQLLKEKDVEIVLIGTPDHWHALPMIEAVNAGMDVYCQKPIGVDVVECQAMLAAARKTNRVVQIGTQRRSTPHLIDCKKIIEDGKLGKIAHVEIYCYYHMRATDTPPDEAPPANLDYEMWTGPAPMRPYNKLCHPRRWRAFMEYGNGIVGDMCVHMLDMTRWMMNLGWPKSVASSGGIFVDKKSKANITDTQTATFDFGDVDVVWNHRTWGGLSAGFEYDVTGKDGKYPRYPWGATFYGDRGTLECSVMGYTFVPEGKNPAIEHKDVKYELDEFPEDKTEKDLEKHVAPAIRGHMKDLLRNIVSRGKPVADIEQGCISSASSIMANVAMQLGRTLTWDAAKGQVKGDDEANKLLKRPYRGPWVHPEV